MPKKITIASLFAVKAPTGLSWPGIKQNYQERVEYYQNLLKKNFESEDTVFETIILTASTKDEELKKIANRYDGVLLFLLAHGTALGQRISPMLKHGLIIDDPFGGSGDIIRTTGVIRDKGLPVETIGTLDENALVRKIDVYLAVPRIQKSRILVFKSFEKMSLKKEKELNTSIGTGSTMKRYCAGKAGFDKKVETLKNIFGIDVVMMTLKDLNLYRDKVNEDDAKKMAEKWYKEAEEVVEPSKKDLFESAKMYFALEKAKADCPS